LIVAVKKGTQKHSSASVLPTRHKKNTSKSKPKEPALTGKKKHTKKKLSLPTLTENDLKDTSGFIPPLEGKAQTWGNTLSIACITTPNGSLRNLRTSPPTPERDAV
jgi:hypothetical protein